MKFEEAFQVVTPSAGVVEKITDKEFKEVDLNSEKQSLMQKDQS